MSKLINRVANSGLITLNLEDYFPNIEIVPFDMADFLFQGLILKEKDFRSEIREISWIDYQDKVLAVHCSADAIVPVWAYMLITSLVSPYAVDIYHGTPEEYLKDYYRNLIQNKDYSEYKNQRIVIKGCSKKPVPPAAYLELTKVLTPLAKSIMYGEPCSTVPIYKEKR